MAQGVGPAIILSSGAKGGGENGRVATKAKKPVEMGKVAAKAMKSASAKTSDSAAGPSGRERAEKPVSQRDVDIITAIVKDK